MFSVWKIKLFFIIRYINIIYIFDLLNFSILNKNYQFETKFL